MIEDLKEVQSSGSTNLTQDTTEHLPFHTHDGLNSPKVTAPQEMYIPAEAMGPTGSNGCADLAQETDTAVDMWNLAFDTSSEESAFFTVGMPENWNGKLHSAKFYWRANSGSAGDGVVWGIKAHGYKNDEAISQTYGAEVVVADALTAADDILITDKTPEIIPNNNGNLLQFRVSRKPGNSADDLAADALLIGISIIYGIK